MYVGNYRSNTVSVINASNHTVVATILVGPFPQAIVYNSSNNDMYVANFGSNTVSVISTNTPVQPPSGTTITLAIDGNGNTVQNQSSTVSTSITFHVTATQGTNPLSGFQCSLDSSAYEPCTVTDSGLITYNNLASGQQHTFKVRAVDNQVKVDSTPTTFTWRIQKLIATNLLSEIDGIPTLSTFTKSSIEDPLKTSITLLNNNHQTLATCFTMKAFLQIANINENAGQLSHQQAAELKQQAINIQKAMGCFSLHPFQFSNGGGGDDDDDHRINNNSLKPFNDDDRIDNG